MGGRKAETRVALTAGAAMGNFLPTKSNPIDVPHMNHHTPSRAPQPDLVRNIGQTDDPCDQAISALATLSGLPADSVAVQACVLLGDLAGPHGGLVTLGGEFQPFQVNLITLGSGCPAQSRLIDLLFAQLHFVQDDLHALSRNTPRKTLEHYGQLYTSNYTNAFPKPFTGEAHEEAVWESVLNHADRSRNATSRSYPVERLEILRHHGPDGQAPGVGGPRNAYSGGPPANMYTPNERPMVISPEELRSLHEPTVFLDNPSAADLLAAFAEADRQSPFVLDRYGALLAEAAERNGSRARTALETLILRGVVSRDPGSGLGRMAGSQGSLFAATDPRTFSRLLEMDQTARIVQQAILTRPRPHDHPPALPIDKARIDKGYELYRYAVRSVVTARRRNSDSISPVLPDDAAIRFFEEQRSFQAKLADVDPELRPHAAHFVHLPATILFGLRRLGGCKCPGTEVPFIDLIPRAMRISEVAMQEHLHLVRRCMESGNEERLKARGVEMLVKIFRKGPCTMRTLFRSYPEQQKWRHLPILDHLTETGMIAKSPSGHLCLTEKAQQELQTISQK